VIAAARAIYNRAIADGLIDPTASPAHRVVKPRRLPSIRRALSPQELEQINLAARTSSNDVVLDALLLRLHTETACRRGGALGLQLADLDTENGLVQLTEKGSTLRWQPITLDLATHLDEHARSRGAVAPTDALLRYRNGQAITSRRYDHLWKRIGEQLPWVAAQGVSTHWLRHTTLTWVETALQLWHCPRVRRAHRLHWAGHHHLHQSRPVRRRSRNSAWSGGRCSWRRSGGRRPWDVRSRAAGGSSRHRRILQGCGSTGDRLSGRVELPGPGRCSVLVLAGGDPTVECKPGRTRDGRCPTAAGSLVGRRDAQPSG
jgi:hypothetical protein